MDARQNTGLQIIFSVFLGLMVAAFLGVGVYTFYPPPGVELQERLDELRREQEDVGGFQDPAGLTAGDRTRMRALEREVRDLEDRLEAVREVWGRNTSIILITFATIVMAVSLIRADQLPVISSGLLLGGVFTMVYGVGWIIATGTSIARFIVMTVALLITLALGYVRFVRVKRAREPTAGQTAGALPTPAPGASEADSAPPSVSTGEMGDIRERVRTLEERMDAASAALGPSAGTREQD